MAEGSIADASRKARKLNYKVLTVGSREARSANEKVLEVRVQSGRVQLDGSLFVCSFVGLFLSEPTE
jgi:hypothetical protein